MPTSILKCSDHLFAYDRPWVRDIQVDPRLLGKVAVLYGGTSSERVISLESGKRIFEALKNQGVQVTLIDAAEDYLIRLKSEDFDRAFIALHGGHGENGSVQGALDCLGLPYTGSDASACALAMDKARSKLIFEALSLPTPNFGIAYDLSQAQTLSENLKYPLAVKPISEGSSIGASFIHDAKNLEDAFQQARRYGPVIIEEMIQGKDIFVTVLMGEALPSVQVTVDDGVYDYHAKYESDSTRYDCPAPLTEAQENEIRNLAKKAFYALGCRAWGRVDFILDKQQKFWILEVNTVPGMTSHSLVPLSAQAASISYDALVYQILVSSLELENEQNKSNSLPAQLKNAQ